MAETEGPESSSVFRSFCRGRYPCSPAGFIPFFNNPPPSTNSLPLPPPPPPPFIASHSSTSAIVHPLLIAVIPSFAFALALGLYYVLAARLCPNRGFFFLSGLLSLGGGSGGRRRFRRPLESSGGGGQSSFFAWPAHAARGLDESLIGLIPVCTYTGVEQGLVSGSECAVCLGEFRQGEVLRLLPKCNHAFHLACVDKWLRAHTTCPMCRANVVNFNFANAAMAMAATPNPNPATNPPPPDPTAPTPEALTESPLLRASVSMKRSFSEGLLSQNPALAMTMVRTTTTETATTTPCKTPPSSSSSHCIHRALDKSWSFDMSSAKGKHSDTQHPLNNPSMKKPLLVSRVFSDENPTDTNMSTPSSPSNYNHRIPDKSLLGSKISDKNTMDTSTSNIWHPPGNASMTKPLLGSRVFLDENPTTSSCSDYPRWVSDESLLGRSRESDKNATDTLTSSSSHGHGSR